MVRPLRGWDLPDWAEPLQFGIAGTFGNDHGVLSPTTLKTPAFVPWFQYSAAARPDGVRTRWSPELAESLTLGLGARRSQAEHRPRGLTLINSSGVWPSPRVTRRSGGGRPSQSALHS